MCCVQSNISIKEWTTELWLSWLHFTPSPSLSNIKGWHESILSKFLYISILLRCTKNKLYIFRCFQLKTFRSVLEIRVTMNWLTIVILVQTATKLVGSFDLPKPLDNFYEEVVRFYKRLRTEGGNRMRLYSCFVKILYCCWASVWISFKNWDVGYRAIQRNGDNYI